MSEKRTGILCVVSGPSGSGKTTLCAQMKELGECAYSVSCTTRAPREGEVDGVDYHFLSEEEFVAKTTAGEFLESARVHTNLYGTLRSSVVTQLEAGIDVIMDIDVQGAALVRASQDPFIQRSLVDVFILPPSMEEILGRLSGRGTETAAQVALRMKNALGEMVHWDSYEYIITSGSKEDDTESLLSILRAERQAAGRLSPGIIAEIGNRADSIDLGASAEADQADLFQG